MVFYLSGLALVVLPSGTFEYVGSTQLGELSHVHSTMPQYAVIYSPVQSISPNPDFLYCLFPHYHLKSFYSHRSSTL